MKTFLRHDVPVICAALLLAWIAFRVDVALLRVLAPEPPPLVWNDGRGKVVTIYVHRGRGKRSGTRNEEEVGTLESSRPEAH